MILYRNVFIRIIFLGLVLFAVNGEDEHFKLEDVPKSVLNLTRRILQGREAGHTRPYMVYLRGAPNSQVTYQNWLCGGVIIHSRHILTSAACIEDAKHFYVISGTHRWVPYGDVDDECVRNGALKAVWKCVPKSYVFDGPEPGNIRWMYNDIAVVRVEDNFNFEKRVRGCEFIPKMIAFNNDTEDLEKPGTVGSVIGWGSTAGFSNLRDQHNVNSANLLEANAVIISKNQCKKRWPERYHYIIDATMICSKDLERAAICGDDADCRTVLAQDYDEEKVVVVNSKEWRGRRQDSPVRLVQDNETSAPVQRRDGTSGIGGFCENDHGGPFIAGQGNKACVVGVISVAMTTEATKQCHGPFLYTSVWRNRHVIECAIGREMGTRRQGYMNYCRKLLRISKTTLRETHYSWKNHPDGPSKSELNSTQMRATLDHNVPGEDSLLDEDIAFVL